MKCTSCGSQTDDLGLCSWCGFNSYKHELELIDAATRHLMTDCSTPCFIRVRQLVSDLKRIEADNDALRQAMRERDEEDSRGPVL